MSQATRTTAVLLIAHGSRREEANRDLLALADRLRADGEHAIVEASFLELAGPDIATGAARCVASGAQRVLMVPYFLSAGAHVEEDLQRAREELAARFPQVAFRLAKALGPHPLLDELVRERARETDLDDS